MKNIVDWRFVTEIMQHKWCDVCDSMFSDLNISPVSISEGAEGYVCMRIIGGYIIPLQLFATDPCRLRP